MYLTFHVETMPLIGGVALWQKWCWPSGRSV
jgi:hypothetical protein